MESGSNTSRFHQKVFLRIYVTPSIKMVSVLKCYCVICEVLPNHLWLQRLCISVQFSHSVMSNSLWSYGLQHARLPCPSPTPGACSNSYPLSWWCHQTISSSVIPFSCLQSFPALGSFPMSQLFTSGSLSDFTFTFTFMNWRRKWQPTPVFLPGESQGRGSLVGCHLWGRTESNTTEAT